MNKILNFNEYKNEVEENKKYALNKVSQIEKIFYELYQKERKDIEENENLNNFNFLLKNFKKINIDIKNGHVTPKELQLINNKLYSMLEKEEFAISRIYIILCFYNAYRIYNKKFLELSANDSELITSLLAFFEQENDVKTLDNISDFIFDEDLIKNLRELVQNEKMLLNKCVSIVEMYIEENEIKAPVEYYAKEELEYTKEARELNEKHGPGFLGYGIITTDFLQNRLSENLENMAVVMTPDKYFSLKSKIDMLKYKVENISNESKKSFFEAVRNISDNDDFGPHEKLELILNYLDTLYDITSKNEEENKGMLK